MCSHEQASEMLQAYDMPLSEESDLQRDEAWHEGHASMSMAFDIYRYIPARDSSLDQL